MTTPQEVWDHNHNVDVKVPDDGSQNFPTIAVREEFDAFAKEMNWPSEIIPGRFGLGVMVKP